MQMIEKNNYVNYDKYKLNIKMPLIYVLKYYVVCMYLWHQFDRNSAIKGQEDSNKEFVVESEEI